MENIENVNNILGCNYYVSLYSYEVLVFNSYGCIVYTVVYCIGRCLPGWRRLCIFSHGKLIQMAVSGLPRGSCTIYTYIYRGKLGKGDTEESSWCGAVGF
jgi:hypothetical protein